MIYKTLKGPTSDAMFDDIIIAGQDLCYATNSGANLSMMCRWSQTREVERVQSGGFFLQTSGSLHPVEDRDV